jgi:4-amino-4-deoxychorismate lyase
VLINGKTGDSLAATDRGLLYGDGLFETLAVCDGTACLWHRHMQRLEQGCRRLGMEAPNATDLANEAARLVEGRDRGILKIIVTRGSGGRGYRPDPGAPSRRILQLFPSPDYPADWGQFGVELRFCTTPLAANPVLAGIKHLNRLEQVLARAEWDTPGIAEGLMADLEGRVIEGTMSNLFLVSGGELTTPPVDRCGVAGVMRALVLDLASRLGIPARIAEIRRPDLQHADALFMTNSLIGIWPVRQLERWSYDIAAIPDRLRKAVEQYGFAAGDVGSVSW